jgi:hypothetical protein
VGSVCCVKRFTTRWHTFRWWRRGWNGRVEVAETTVKRLLRCGFRRINKAMAQLHQCWWGICREINFSPGSNIACFMFYNHLRPTYSLSLAIKRRNLYAGARSVEDTTLRGWRKPSMIPTGWCTAVLHKIVTAYIKY